MYSNNREFRAFLRTYFRMNVSALEEQYAPLKDTDFESYDELVYDQDAIHNGMVEILKKTKDNPLFQFLYSLAAKHFLSEDIEIGLCALLSYDYCGDFIKVYETEPLSESCECYLTLKHKLE